MTIVLPRSTRQSSHKGLSDLISIVLLLAFTIAVAFLIGTWISDLSKNTNDKNQKTIEETNCNYADFSAADENIKYASGANGYVSFTIFNKGRVSLYDFAVFSISTSHASELSLSDSLTANNSLKPGQIVSFNATGNVSGNKFKIFSRICPNVYIEIDP